MNLSWTPETAYKTAACVAGWALGGPFSGRVQLTMSYNMHCWCRFRQAQLPLGTPSTFCSCIICDRPLKALLDTMGHSRPPATAAAAARGRTGAARGRGPPNTGNRGQPSSSQCFAWCQMPGCNCFIEWFTIHITDSTACRIPQQQVFHMIMCKFAAKRSQGCPQKLVL